MKPTPPHTPRPDCRHHLDHLDVTSLFEHDRTLIMGILNVTADSFSDGGIWLPPNPDDPHVAVAHALDMIAQGADIIDVGGESTRPGAQRVTEDEEAQRVLPVVEALAKHGITISVDTMRATIARQAIQAGAHIINDVSGGLADEAMLGVAAETGAALCLMHWDTERFGDADATGGANAREGEARAPHPESAADGSGEARAPQPGGAQTPATHGDQDAYAATVAEYLRQRAEDAQAAGVGKEKIILDPGLGFAKTAENNWTLLRGMSHLTKLGYPVLIGASRKRFLTTLVPSDDGTPCPPAEADPATAAVTALASFNGAWAVRVHSVKPSADAVRVAQAWTQGSGPAIPQGWRAKRG